MAKDVDHGKTSLLDKIRTTAIARAEAGGITQCISCANININTIKNVCGNLFDTLKMKISIPGVVFIDTPGHAAFNNLRKRGGNLADIAILVVDVNEGFKSQTLECIEILKYYKTPFVIALNKIDLIPGWRSGESLIKTINSQSQHVKEYLDTKLYSIVGRLSEFSFNSERFDRVEDYTKQVVIIPMSAKTGEGIPELLMILTGLSQKYLESPLSTNGSGLGKGTILEVKEEKGIGLTLDVIIYDGTIKVGDTIVIGSFEEPIVTKVKGLFEPEKNKLKPIKEVHAASGVKILALDLEKVSSGMPIHVSQDIEKTKEEVQKEIKEVLMETDNEGIIAKADSLGSLEALIHLLKEHNIKVKRASIGEISKKDISEASAETNPVYKVILGFNVKSIDIKEIKLITHDIIYKLIEDYNAWKEKEEKSIKLKQLEGITRPCSLKILPNCTFRKSNPAIVGVAVVNGLLTRGTNIMKDGKRISYVKELQLEGKSIPEAGKGKEIAISLPDVMVGRQINENDILYSDLSESEFRKLKDLKTYLSSDEIGALKEIAAIKRKDNSVWGV